jgi:outer membrane protein
MPAPRRNAPRRPALARLVRHAVRHAPLAAAIALALAGPARAQSLLELYRAAHEHDAVYLSAKALAESRRFFAAQTEALARPRADVSASVGRSHVNPPVGPSSTGSSSFATLAARQPLFNRPNQITIEQARKQLEAARYELEAAEQDLIVRVAQAYFDVLAAQDALGAAQQNRAAINEQLASARRNFEVGTATITDTREAQARFDLATAQEIIAENALRDARIVLEQLVGRPQVQPWPLDTPAALPPLPGASVDEWVNRAYQQHPSVRGAEIGYETARLETDKARAARLPALDAAAALDTSGAGRPFNRDTRSASIALQLSMPLYTGGLIQNRVRETLLLEESAREDLEAARRTVATATRQIFFGIQSGEAQVRALEAAEASSQLALDATQLGYRVGVRVNLDVLNAQTQLYTARRDLARARYDVLLNHLRLRQAAGELSAEDVVRLEPLFEPPPAPAPVPAPPARR